MFDFWMWVSNNRDENNKPFATRRTSDFQLSKHTSFWLRPSLCNSSEISWDSCFNWFWACKWGRRRHTHIQKREQVLKFLFHCRIQQHTSYSYLFISFCKWCRKSLNFTPIPVNRMFSEQLFSACQVIEKKKQTRKLLS